MIAKQLAQVQEKICGACERSGRSRSEVTLIAVSKTKPVTMIREVMAHGIQDFGENKAQEIVDKTSQITEPLRWHMIGHLQRNKVKYIADRVFMIHSVDSLRLAKEIDKEAAKCSRVIPILIEVNVAGEESKFGVSVEETLPLIQSAAQFPNIRISGLMTIAPFVENPEENRRIFRTLRKLYIDIKTKNIDNVYMEYLSMGMTNDYEVAIEEGASFVRVGTGIFGERNYNAV